MALGVCPKRKFVVSGSLGARPDIIVWDSDTMNVVARNKLGRNTRAVSSIRFSKDGKLFFCTDKHNDSNVYCFKADTAELLGQNKCGSDPVFDGEAGDTTFAVATKRGVYFFEYSDGSLDQKRGIFNGNPMAPQIVITYNSETKSFFSGTSQGDLYEWQGNTCIKSAKVH
jgi:outer membrane protein assembly factor BamB